MILTTVPSDPNGVAYTAIMRGANNTTGLGVVEVYDLDLTVDSKLANIATRGRVDQGDNVLIAGTIVLGSGTTTVLFRALGPSTGIPNGLEDPTLELHDGQGGIIATNDNWQNSQAAEIEAQSRLLQEQHYRQLEEQVRRANDEIQRRRALGLFSHQQNFMFVRHQRIWDSKNASSSEIFNRSCRPSSRVSEPRSRSLWGCFLCSRFASIGRLHIATCCA